VTAAALAACASLLCADTGRLALMPLPKSSLGADAAPLTLSRDSGVDSNASAAKNAGGGVTAADLARQGRITGYTLLYTDPTALATHRRLLGVQTIAELYRSRATAVRGLAFWRGVTRGLAGTKHGGVAIGVTPFSARVGDGAFAFQLTYSLAGKRLAYVGDVVFRTGSLLGAVFVTSASPTGLRARTVALAEKLLARMLSVAPNHA
jgi:hypothetical protein